MGAQVGILSLSQLQLHDHYNYNSGGPILSVARVAAATVKINHAAAVVEGGTTQVAVKRIMILEDSPGTCDINFTITNTLGAGTANGRVHIVRAGAVIWSGILRNEIAGPNTYTDAGVAVDLLAGDIIELRASRTGATTCLVEDFQVCYDGYVSTITRRALNAALLLTAASDILYQFTL